MTVDKVLREAVHLGGVRLDALLAVRDIAVEHRLLFGGFIIQLSDSSARGFVFVDPRQTEFQQLPLHVVASCVINMGNIQSGERVVKVVIERQRCLRG